MNLRASLLLLFTFAFLSGSLIQAATVQTENNVLADGSAFLWVEGEDVFQLSDGDPADAEVGFILVNKNDPIQTITEDANGNEVVKGGLDVLPADTNASGGAGIFAQLGGGGTAKWQMQFAIPATYYLYVHWSVYNRDNNTNYGNEDSFYVPPDFNLNSRGDWIGYEGVDLGGNEKIGDSDRDGYIDGFPSFAQNYVSAGEVEAHNSTDEDFYDGQFHWYWLSKANDMDENNAFISFDGHAIQYDVSDAELGTVLDYEISYREPYGAIDGLLFSTSDTLLLDYTQEQMDEFFLGGTVVGDFDDSGVLDLPDVNLLNSEIAAGTNNPAMDLNADNSVNETDLDVWVKDLRVTWFGDSNLDGEFNSGDLVGVFQAGKYEVDTDAAWEQGDWTGDKRFDSGDLVKAFQDGGFEKGPIAANVVPEPSSLALFALMGLAVLTRLRRR